MQQLPAPLHVDDPTGPLAAPWLCLPPPERPVGREPTDHVPQPAPLHADNLAAHMRPLLRALFEEERLLAAERHRALLEAIAEHFQELQARPEEGWPLKGLRPGALGVPPDPVKSGSLRRVCELGTPSSPGEDSDTEGLVQSHYSAAPRSVEKSAPEESRETPPNGHTVRGSIFSRDSDKNPSIPSLAEHGIRAKVYALLMGPWFESFFVSLIMLNSLFLAVEAQYSGCLVGEKVGYPHYEDVFAGTFWPGAMAVFDYSEFIFGVLFSLELCLKMFCFRAEILVDLWNWLDIVIVVAWFVDTVAAVQFFLPPTILRFVRMIRLIRLLRLVRTFKAFDSLFLMMTAIRHSCVVLLWSITLLALILVVCALLLQSLTVEFISNEAEPLEARREVFMFYGTFARNMLTMFEMTVGNWMPPTRALVENYSEWFLLFALLHKMVIGFAVVGVINAVFVQETFKVAQTDDHVMMLRQERAARLHASKMQDLFAHADRKGEGALSLEDFRAVLDEPEVRMWLASMELAISDVGAVFRLLDDGDGRLTAAELVQGVSRLKGTARSIDVAAISQDLRRQRVLIKKLFSLILDGPSESVLAAGMVSSQLSHFNLA